MCLQSKPSAEDRLEKTARDAAVCNRMVNRCGGTRGIDGRKLGMRLSRELESSGGDGQVVTGTVKCDLCTAFDAGWLEWEGSKILKITSRRCGESWMTREMFRFLRRRAWGNADYLHRPGYADFSLRTSDPCSILGKCDLHRCLQSYVLRIKTKAAMMSP